MLAEARAIPQDYDENLGLAFLQPFVAPYVRDHREEGELLGQESGFQRVCTLLFAAITGQRMQCPRTYIWVGVVQFCDQTRQARIIIDMVQYYATTDSDQMFWML